MVRDYSKGLIYKLCCKNVNVKEIYVGSTINMKQRKRQHKQCAINENSEKHNIKVYQYIRENGGWSNWSMIWIKDYPSNSKRELETEEDKIMKELNATLNAKDAIKDIEKRKKQCREYKQNHKEEIKIKTAEWREKNKEHLKEYGKNRVRPNYEELQLKKKEIVICECGATSNKGHIARHRKTKKHQSFISSNI